MFSYFIYEYDKTDLSELQIKLAPTHADALRMILADIKAHGVDDKDNTNFISNRLYHAMTGGKSVSASVDKRYQVTVVMRYIYAGRVSTRVQDYGVFHTDRVAILQGMVANVMEQRQKYEDSKTVPEFTRLHCYTYQNFPYTEISLTSVRVDAKTEAVPFTSLSLEELSDITDSMDEALEMAKVSCRYEREAKYWRDTLLAGCREMRAMAGPDIAKQAQKAVRQLDNKSILELCQTFDFLAELTKMQQGAGVDNTYFKH